MRKAELLARLQNAVTPDEWDALEHNLPLPVSSFHRSVLLELRDTSITDGRGFRSTAAVGLDEALRDDLAEHMADQPEGWKWVILASLYLALIVERPLHAIQQQGIRVTETERGTLYECPAKSAIKNAVCGYCVCQRMSNYEITKRQMAQKFAAYGQTAIIRRFGLDSSADWIAIRFLHSAYRIDRASGVIFRLEDSGPVEAGFNEAMTIYDVLCSEGADCALAGEFVTLGGLVKAANAPGQSGQDLFGKKRDLFDRRERALALACERLGGEKYGKGDVAYRLPLFDFLPVVFQFWNSDEEFPASMQLLWDKNTLRFMHFETVWYAAGHLLDRLAALLDSEEPTVP